MVQLNKEYDLCDTWRIRNLLEKSFTFQQNRRLDYIFTSNTLQEFSNKAIILSACKTEHSYVSVIISNYNKTKPDQDLWKFNNSRISDEDLTEELKNLIENLKEDPDSKEYKNDLNNSNKLQKYNKIKSELEQIHEKIREGAKVRSKCTWYKEEEKYT